MSGELVVPDEGEFLVYKTDAGRVRVDVRLAQGSVWLTQQQLAELFQTTKQNISHHIRAIYEDGEMEPSATVKYYLTVRQEGSRIVRRELEYYSLELILAVGYRVKSLIATRFRIWATRCLKQYLVKGFVLDDERLKNPPVGASAVPDYFDEMLERIRDIRASERRVYLRVREIFALAADYEPSLGEANRFFSVIQNKLHFAVTGQTAAELIQARADPSLPNMGLTSWKADEVRKSDVTIAKNYLREDEILELNRIVVMWLDFAEDQALRRKQVFMRDWECKLDDFLRFNDRPVLPDAGRVSKRDAERHAWARYEHFSARRREIKESLGEIETIRQLEAAARELGEGKPTGEKGDRGRASKAGSRPPTRGDR